MFELSQLNELIKADDAKALGQIIFAASDPIKEGFDFKTLWDIAQEHKSKKCIALIEELTYLFGSGLEKRVDQKEILPSSISYIELIILENNETELKKLLATHPYPYSILHSFAVKNNRFACANIIAHFMVHNKPGILSLQKEEAVNSVTPSSNNIQALEALQLDDVLELELKDIQPEESNSNTTASAKTLEHSSLISLLKEEYAQLHNPKSPKPLWSQFNALGTFKNYQEIIQNLILAGASPTHAAPKQHNALQLATIFGLTESLRTLIGDKKEFANYTDADNVSLLHFAASFGQAEAFALLISLEADPSKTTRSEGRNCLHMAAASCSTLEENPDPKEVKIIQQNQLKIIRLLLRKFPQLTESRDKKDYTPLARAVGDSQVDAAKLLISSGASVNVLTKTGASLLHLALSNNNEELFNIIILENIHPEIINAINALGLTSLAMAIRDKKFNAAQKLLKNGADISIADQKNRSPLHAIVVFTRAYTSRGSEVAPDTKIEASQRLVTLKMMLKIDEQRKAKKEKSIIDSQIETSKATALHLAATEGYEQAVTLLLACGSNPFLTNKAGLTPLCNAILSGNLHCVQSLLRANRNLLHSRIENYNSYQNITSLSLAILSHQSEEMINELIAAGAKLTEPDKDGNVPIHHAALMKDYLVVALLADENCIILSLENSEGLTPVDIIANNLSNETSEDKKIEAQKCITLLRTITLLKRQKLAELKTQTLQSKPTSKKKNSNRKKNRNSKSKQINSPQETKDATTVHEEIPKPTSIDDASNSNSNGNANSNKSKEIYLPIRSTLPQSEIDKMKAAGFVPQQQETLTCPTLSSEVCKLISLFWNNEIYLVGSKSLNCVLLNEQVPAADTDLLVNFSPLEVENILRTAKIPYRKNMSKEGIINFTAYDEIDISCLYQNASHKLDIYQAQYRAWEDRDFTRNFHVEILRSNELKSKVDQATSANPPKSLKLRQKDMYAFNTAQGWDDFFHKRLRFIRGGEYIVKMNPIARIRARRKNGEAGFCLIEEHSRLIHTSEWRIAFAKEKPTRIFSHLVEELKTLKNNRIRREYGNTTDLCLLTEATIFNFTLPKLKTPTNAKTTSLYDSTLSFKNKDEFLKACLHATKEKDHAKLLYILRIGYQWFNEINQTLIENRTLFDLALKIRDESCLALLIMCGITATTDQYSNSSVAKLGLFAENQATQQLPIPKNLEQAAVQNKGNL